MRLNYLTLFIFLLSFNISCNNSADNSSENNGSTANSDKEIPKAIQLFNGEDIDDWIPKIRFHEAGDNYANTFRVEDGILKVRYDDYEGDFNDRYGHLAYKDPFSYYILRIEYRFVGEQIEGGPGWAWRNNGAMLHGQDPATMGLEQDYPISVEGQLLGGDGESDRPTSNVCTPGTHIVLDGELFTPHCQNSTSKTYHGDQWVTADFVVLGDSLIQHILEGEVVLEYTEPQIGGGNVEGFDPEVKEDGKILDKGFIHLQSESHPTDFRKIELYDLADYKDDAEKIDEIVKEILMN